MNILLLRLSSHYHIQSVLEQNNGHTIFLLDHLNNSFHYSGVSRRLKILRPTFLANIWYLLYGFYSLRLTTRIHSIIVPYNNPEAAGYGKWLTVLFFCFSARIESIDKKGTATRLSRSRLLMTCIRFVCSFFLNSFLSIVSFFYFSFKPLQKKLFFTSSCVAVFVKKAHIKGGSQKIVFDLIKNNPDISFIIFSLQPAGNATTTIFEKFPNAQIICFTEPTSPRHCTFRLLTVIDWLSLLRTFWLFIRINRTRIDCIKSCTCVLNLIDQTFYYSLLYAAFFKLPLIYYIVEDITKRTFPERLFLANASLLLSDSSYMQNKIAQVYSLPVTLLYYGLQDTVPTEAAQATRKKLALEDHIVIGTMGRLDRFKGQLNIVKIALELFRQGYDFRVLLIGSIEYRDAEVFSYYREIQHLAAASQYADRFIFLGHVEAVADYMALYDIFLHLPQAIDPNPIMIYYAMAAGKPVITYRNESSLEQLDNGNCGTLITSRDSRQVQEALKDLIVHKDKRKLLGNRAQEYFKTHFSYVTFNTRIRNILNVPDNPVYCTGPGSAV